MTPEIREFLDKPVALIITKANVKSRVHRRAHLDYIGVKLFSRGRRARRRAAHRRPVHLQRLHRHGREIPYVRRKVAQGGGARRLRRGELSGRALLQRARQLSPRRAVPDRRGHALPLRHRHPAADRAPAHPGACARRRVRPLRLGARLHPQGPLRHQRSPPRRRVSGRRSTRAGSRPPIRPTPRGRWPAPTTSSAATRARPRPSTPRRSRAASPPSCAPGATRWRRARRHDRRTARAARSPPATRTPSAAAYREAFDADGGAGGHRRSSRRSSDARPRAVDFYRRDGDADTRANLKVFSRGRPMPLSERVPLLENLGFRVVNERTYRVEPPAPREADRVWLHDMTLERASGGAASTSTQMRGAARAGAAGAVARRRRNPTRFNTPGAGGRRSAGATRRCCAPSAAICARSACPTARTIWPARWRAMPRIVGKLVALFHARFDPEGRSHGERRPRDLGARRDRAAARRGRRASTTTASCAASCKLIEAAVRTNFFQTTRTAGTRADHRVQVRMRQGRRHAAAAGRSTRSSSIRRASRACICASARWRAAACAGPTGRRISAPRCSASSRRSR